MSNDVAEIEEFGKRWVKAELDGDTGAMDSLAHNDFLLVGPLGFILTRPSGWSVTAAAHSSPQRSIGVTPRCVCSAIPQW